ncbi:MAG TPA: 2OG-Fe(II) oxygenase [Allosphingosinicella sp.]|nr:2OG-Fe(II) oxygenase [Allosphingosinicella sp.]
MIDDFFDPEALRQAYRSIPPSNHPSWTYWGSGGKEDCRPEDSKRGIADTSALPPSIGSILLRLNGEEAVREISAVTGVADLVTDPTLWGGGLQCSGRGASLRVHADRSRHPDPERFDQAINLLLYINPHWIPDYGGDLELWSADASVRVRSVAPLFNRLVLFKSDTTTFHGHPSPNRCPPGLYRASLAVFYYVRRPDSEKPPVNKVQWR